MVNNWIKVSLKEERPDTQVRLNQQEPLPVGGGIFLIIFFVLFMGGGAGGEGSAWPIGMLLTKRKQITTAIRSGTRTQMDYSV